MSGMMMSARGAGTRFRYLSLRFAIGTVQGLHGILFRRLFRRRHVRSPMPWSAGGLIGADAKTVPAPAMAKSRQTDHSAFTGSGHGRNRRESVPTMTRRHNAASGDRTVLPKCRQRPAVSGLQSSSLPSGHCIRVSSVTCLVCPAGRSNRHSSTPRCRLRFSVVAGGVAV